MKIHLQYTDNKGKLSLYFNAIGIGKALCNQCPQCHTKTFPPRLCCEGTYNFAEIPNTGRIIHRTNTPDSAFALVQFQGCINMAMVHILNPDTQGNICILTPPPNDKQGLFVRVQKDKAYV